MVQGRLGGWLLRASVRSLRTAPSGGRPVCRLAPSAQIVPAKPSPVHALLIRMFDLLQLGEKDYRPEPLKVSRKTLEKLVKGQTLILPARRLSPNGLAAWAEVLHRGYEGMVAKDPQVAQGQSAELPGEGTGLGVKLVMDRQPTSRLSCRNTLTTPSGSIYTKHGGRV